MSTPFISEHKAQKTSIIYSPAFRSILFQVLSLIAIAAFLYSIVNNTQANLEARGITTGFDFLSEKAGFNISMSLIEYSGSDTYGRTFFVGLLNTVLVSFLGIVLASVLGFIIGVARLSSNWLIKKVASAYIEIFRNIPLLLQIFFWYFAVLQTLPSPRNSLSLGEAIFLNVRGLYVPSIGFNPEGYFLLGTLILGVCFTFVTRLWGKTYQAHTGKQVPMGRVALVLCIVAPAVVFLFSSSPVTVNMPVLKGFNFSGGITVIPELVALLLALSIYTAAFIAEIVRSGINSVSDGQKEAALSLGIGPVKTLKLIVIPQAMRVIVPPLTSQYLNLTKNSSLAMAIGYPDLVSVFAGTTLNQTGQAIEIIAMTMAVYLTLSLATSLVMNVYNKKVMLTER
ncbi:MULTISPECIES: amino acid ABC transporter permease [unclassified Salinivibrio]|uniref:amino acid ABC transporter permease n=1 Tax=unclassified Salinivibrio TaxID=2636825 RepID=UPI00128C277F|nr:MULTISPECIES: amino acid ABC transporter permease [unclassified Salinivibrio]MPS31233.1 amino acid ABC transporter permease [Salinivibrio sp. VYel7]MPX92633.1 amino acid ABC transporter permease [Salinivibrio sp. VYel9]MPX96868.1 amino acid ABC transporter permease [Salinivibrio sp. VYel6]MPX98866.1 amino acid ABC transporter permease [Salinivibrio sp. VYel4]MPY01433.1 amino acid ABC transporter permease [Salinivibrio sp. VYel5]